MSLLKEPEVKEFTLPGDTSRLRVQCRTCERWLDRADMYFRKCPYCLEEQARKMLDEFRPIDTSKEQFPKCAECNQPIIQHGLRLWDTTANAHALKCIDCGYKQIQRDRQYLDTPWAYFTKLS